MQILVTEDTEWLEANGNLPFYQQNPVARLNQDERRSTSTRKWEC
jgi:iron complex outermembrane receptor protein